MSFTCIAQNVNENKIEQTEKIATNISDWNSNVQTQKFIPANNAHSNPIIQKTSSTTKEVKVTNPEGYYSSETGKIKLMNLSERNEVIEKRDAQSRTFQNTDGSFTKVQTNGYFHYKDANGNWIPFDGTLTHNQKNANIYEVAKTDLPIRVDISTGKTTMALEKDQYISFGDNVNLIVMDKDFNEVNRIADTKSKNNSIKEKEISLKNSWTNIDRHQEVDYWYAKSDYVINSKPNYNNTDGYLVFEDKIDIPVGWQIIKSSEGEETATGWKGDLIIKNNSGKEVGRFHTPIYYENSTNNSNEKKSCSATKKESDVQNINKNAENNRTIIGSYRINESNGKYTLSVVVPLNWFLSENRTYPVTIDPTASNTYASGNIASCYYSTFNSVNMNVTVPAGSTVTATNSQCTYIAVSPTWLSDGWIGFQSGSNLDGYWYCNTNSAGTCNVTGTSNSTIANGTYSSGTVPFTLKVSRDYPSGSCSTTNLYVSNSTWTETVTYTPPCTAPGAPTLTSPSANANVQPGKPIHFTWNAPTTGTTPFTYTLYFYNGSSWQNYSAGSNTYFDLQLSEYNSSTWCGTSAQWYVKATNSCGNTNSSTWNLVPYPKYSGSTVDYTITPSSSCQSSGAHSIVQGGADYYSFNATAGNTYYFSTCSTDLGCGTSTTWDTYLKIFGTNGSCTTSAYNDDGGACSNGTSFINGWTCTTSGTYYLQITGYNSSAHGTYYLEYKYCTPAGAPTLTFPANNANIQPGKVTHYTWNAPTTGSAPFTYTFYFYNGSSWSNWSCDTNRYIDLQLLEYNSASWCGTNAQWYVKATNSCGNTNSATWNLIPYPKYSGSTADYTITPTSGCQSSGAHSIIQGGADYYSFNATAGNTYYFSTCSTDLGCGTNTGWDTYLKIYGTNGSCTTSAYNDDGSACTHNESFINGWTCSTTGTYYVQITGYNSSAYGTYYLQYKETCPTLTASLTGGSSPICYNTAPSMFTATGSGGSGTYSYLWYRNGTSTGITTQTYTAPALTSNATIYCAVSSCGQTVNTSTYSVTVYSNLTANISGGTTSICYNSSPGTFTATGSGGTGSYTYLWYKDNVSTGTTTQTYNPGNLTASSSVYCAITSGTCGTVNTSTTNITVNSLPVAEAGNDTTITAGDSIMIGSAQVSGYTYIWYPATGLTSSTIANPVAFPASTTTYYVTVTNVTSCVALDSVTVIVLPPVPVTKLITSDCGAVDVAFEQILTAEPVSNATQYQFLVENASLNYSETIIKQTNTFILFELPNPVKSSTTYNVKVKTTVGNRVSDYGDACQVTTKSDPAAYIVTKNTDPDPYIYPYDFNDAICASEMYGTLQWALRKANDSPADSVVINFNIAGTAPFEITERFAFPQITKHIIIDGTSQSGYQPHSPSIILNGTIELYGADGSVIKGLYVKNASYNGIYLYSVNNATIEDNIINRISHSTQNMQLAEGGIGLVNSSNNRMTGNIIGTDLTNNNYACINGISIQHYGSTGHGNPVSNNNIIGGGNAGDGNIVTNCTHDGVWIGQGCTYNRISRNTIYNNDNGIFLSSGANQNKQAPEITSVEGDTISGSSAPGDLIEVFGGNGNQDANEYITSVNADGNGDWQTLVSTNYEYYSAIATDVLHNSSMFSLPYQAPVQKTKLIDPDCGLTDVTFNQELKTKPLYLATEYEFHVTENGSGLSGIITNNTNTFSLSELSIPLHFNSIYSVVVKAKIGNLWGVLGDTCKVTTVKSNTITVCKDEKMNYEILGTDTNDNVTITVHLPNNISSLDSAVIYGYPGTPVNVNLSNPSYPQYSFTAPGTDFILNFYVHADCQYFNPSTTNLNFVISKNINGNITADTLKTNINTAYFDFSIPSSQNISKNNAHADTPFDRLFVFKNNTNTPFTGDFLFVDSMAVVNPHNSAIQITSIEFIPSGSATLIYSDTSNGMPQIRGYFQNLPPYGSITVKETIKVIKCPVNHGNNNTKFHAGFGCHSDSLLCKTLRSQSFITETNLDNSYKPQISYTQLNPGYDYCWSDPHERLIKIKNIGNCKADTVFIRVLPETYGDPYNITRIDTSTLNVFRDQALTNPVQIITNNTGNIYCGIIPDGLNAGDSVYVHYYSVFDCIDTSNYHFYFNHKVDVNSEGFPSVTLGSLCLPSTANCDPLHYYNGSWLNSFSLSQSFDNLTGSMGLDEEKWFEVQNSTPLVLGSANGFIFHVDKSKVLVELHLEPGLGIVNDSIRLYSPTLHQYLYPDTILITYTGIPAINANGTIVTGVFSIPTNFYTAANPNNPFSFIDVPAFNFHQYFNHFNVDFKLHSYCGYGIGAGIKENVLFASDYTCNPDCRLPLSSVNDFIFIHCPGCLLPGWNLQTFDMTRTNKGFADNDNNNLPDAVPFQAANPSLIQKHHIMVGDTIECVIKGYTSDGGYVLNSSGDSVLMQFGTIGFNYTYGQFMINGNLLNYMDFIGATGTFSDNSGQYPFTVPAGSGVMPVPGVFTISLDIDSLWNYGVGSGVNRFWNGDSIVIKPKFVVKHNLLNVDNNPYYDNPELDAFVNMSGTPYFFNNKTDALLLIDTIANLNVTERSNLSYWCTGFDGRIITIAADFYDDYLYLGHVNNNSNCYNYIFSDVVTELGEQVDHSPSGFNSFYQNGTYNAWNAFSYELRNLWMLDSVKFNYPSYFSIDKILIYTNQLTNDTGMNKIYTFPISQTPYDYNLSTGSDARISAGSVTVYPASHLDSISSCLLGSFVAWDEIKRFRFKAVLKLNNYQAAVADSNASSFPINYYWSAFPGSQNGDSAITQPMGGSEIFTKPSATLDCQAIPLPASQNNNINMKLVLKINPTNQWLGGDLSEPRQRTNNTFLYFKPSANIHVDSVSCLSTNCNVAVVDTIGAYYLYGLGKLDQVPVELKVKAQYNCETAYGRDSIVILYGWNCFNYPDTLSKACFMDSLIYYIDTLSSGIQTHLAYTDSVSVCDTVFYDLTVAASGLGNIQNLVISFPYSSNSGFSGVPGSAYVTYHGNSTPIPEISTPGLYTWHLDTLSFMSHFATDTLHFHFAVLPGCSFGSHEPQFTITGQNYCGHSFPIINEHGIPVIITNLFHDSLTVHAITPTYNTCMGSSIVSFVVVNNGQGISGSNQLFVELPTNFIYLSGDPYNLFSNNQYQFNLPPILSGDSTIISFSILDTNSLTTGTYPGTALLIQPVTCHSITCQNIFETYGFSIPVNSQLVSATASSNSPVCVGDTLHLYSGGGDYYSWSGPGGGTSTLQNPHINHASLSNAGLYSVTVSDAAGCSDTASVWVVINAYPNVSYTITSDTNCIKLGIPVHFSADIQPGINYTWDFGDSTIVYGDTVSHIFNDFGYFKVSLSDSNSCGSSSYCTVLFVNPPTYTCDTTFDIPKDTLITGNVIWNNTNYPSGVKVRGDIYVTNGSTLNINSTTVRFAPKARLIVKKGGRLKINSGNLTSLNGTDMWQGVEVWGVTDSLSTDSIQGRIYMNQSSISNAYIGVLLGKRVNYTCSTVFTTAQGGFENQKSGGVIIARNSTFTGNGTDIRFNQKTDTSATVSVLDTLTFTCPILGLLDSHYDPTSISTYRSDHNPWAGYANSNKRTIWGIVSVGTNNLNIRKCDFRNLEYGISSFSNKQTFVSECNFRSNRQGIHIDNYLPDIQNFYDISKCTFDSIPGNTAGNYPASLSEDNGTAIYIAGDIGDKIYDGNEFRNFYPGTAPTYGIKTNQASGFDIANNRFNNLTIGIIVQNSGTDGGLIRANASTDTLFSWTGNVFTQCKTGIVTKELNSALCLRCNDLTPNAFSSDTNWVNKPNGTLADQGFDPGSYINTPDAAKYGAGNRFLTNLNKKISTSSPYRYYHHTDANTIPDTIGPITRINVGWNNTAGKFANCHLLTKSLNANLPVSLNDSAFLRLDSLSNVISTLESQYSTLVNNADNGQTPQLLNAINTNLPSEQLNNMLLADSLLSDTVLITLNSQNALSNSHYKNVMEKNLPVIRKVVPSFNSKVETLPSDIKSQLKAKQVSSPGKITIGNLETKLGQTKHTRQLYFNELISSLLSPANNRKADAITLFEREGTPSSNMLLAATYMTDRNYSLAASKIALLPNDDPQFAKWKSYATVLLNHFAQGKTLEELDESQIDFIRTIAYGCPEGMATVNAKAILMYLFMEQVPSCPESGTQSMRFANNSIQKAKSSYLGDNYPDPFNSNTVIPYYLPEGSNGEIIIKDVTGRIILTLSLQSGENTIEINSKDWADGVYLYGMSINGENIENKKMVKTE